MAWIKPVYDRPNLQTRTTATDMNRIVNNMAVLGGSPVKNSYTANDIVKVAEWNAIVSFAQSKDPNVTSSTRFDNLNAIEYAMQQMHDDLGWGHYRTTPWRDVGPTWGDMNIDL